MHVMELFNFIDYFYTVVPFNDVFSFLKSFVVNATFSTGPVENVALTTKGPQERKHNIQWEDGGIIGNQECMFTTSHNI